MIDEAPGEVRAGTERGRRRWLTVGGAGIALAAAVAVGSVLGTSIGQLSSGGAAPKAQKSGDSLALYAAGQNLQAKGEYARALALFAKAVARTPSYVNALVAEAQCYHALHLYTSELSALNRALARDRSNWNTLLARAQIEITLGQAGRALADIRAATGFAPGSDSGTLNTAQSLFYQLNDSGDAIGVLNRAIQVSPSSSSLYLNRAGLYAAENNNPAAARDYWTAAKLSSGTDQMTNLLTLGDWAASVGDGQDATKAYAAEVGAVRIYLKSHSNDATGHTMLAHALAAQNDKNGATREVQAAVAAGRGSSSLVSALQDLADWSANSGRVSLARLAYGDEEAAARSYLSRHRHDAAVRGMLAHAVYQLQNVR